MNEYVTLEFLGSFVGVVAVVLLIVQFLKLKVDKVWKIPTRFIVWLIALVVLVAVESLTSTLTPDKFFLLALNSIVVTLSTMGAYEVTIKKLEK